MGEKTGFPVGMKFGPILSLNRATPSRLTALCTPLPIAPPAAGEAPEWIHVLPAGKIETQDARGPFTVRNAAKIIAASFADTDRLPIDENHATDLAGPRGDPSPARGWIVEMQAREDGIWGRVEWNRHGKELMADRAYRSLSPVIVYSGDKGQEVVRILRASLTNTPNLRGLTALNTEEGPDMDLIEKLRTLFGLGATATEEEILESATALNAALTEETEEPDEGDEADSAQAPGTQAPGEAGTADFRTALQAAGLPETASADDLAKVIAELKTGQDTTITALQSELKGLSSKFNRDRAETYIDGEITRGRVGVKAMRAHYIARHMADPVSVEKEIAALPILAAGELLDANPKNKDEKTVLNSSEREVVGLMGLSAEDFAASRADLQEKGLL